jgi:hypothetical protein
MLRRTTTVLALALAFALLGAGCTTSPVQIGTLPVEGDWIMGVTVLACAPANASVKIEADFYTLDPIWVDLGMSNDSTSLGTRIFTTHSGGHREWTSPPVGAGSCWTFRIASGWMCCTTSPQTGEFGFHYRISQVT